MRRTATLACLFLLAAGPAAVWAEAFACCPVERPVTLAAGDGCVAPVCCVVSAPVPPRPSGQDQPAALGAVPVPAVTVPVAATFSISLGSLGGGSSPAASQTSPVLLL